MFYDAMYGHTMIMHDTQVQSSPFVVTLGTLMGVFPPVKKWMHWYNLNVRLFTGWIVSTSAPVVHSALLIMMKNTETNTFQEGLIWWCRSALACCSDDRADDATGMSWQIFRSAHPPAFFLQENKLLFHKFQTMEIGYRSLKTTLLLAMHGGQFSLWIMSCQGRWSKMTSSYYVAKTNGVIWLFGIMTK